MAEQKDVVNELQDSEKKKLNIFKKNEKFQMNRGLLFSGVQCLNSLQIQRTSIINPQMISQIQQQENTDENEEEPDKESRLHDLQKQIISNLYRQKKKEKQEQLKVKQLIQQDEQIARQSILNQENNLTILNQPVSSYIAPKPDDETYKNVTSLNKIDYEKEDHMDVLAYSLSRKMKNKQDQQLIVNALKQIPLFQKDEKLLSSEKIVPIICKNVGVIKVQQRQVLFNHGKIGDQCFVVLKGGIAILLPENKQPASPTKKKKTIIRQIDQNCSIQKYVENQFPNFTYAVTFKPGQCFGEIALITSERRTATALADQETILLTLSKQGFSNIMEGHKSNEQQEKMKFLQQLPFFKLISRGALLSLLMDTKEVTYKSGDVIYKIDDNVKYVYFIKQGEVEISILGKKDADEQNQLSDNKYVFLNKSKTISLNIQNQQEIKISLKGKNQYFGMEEVALELPKRYHKAVCKQCNTVLVYISKQTLLSKMVEYEGVFTMEEERSKIQQSEDDRESLVRSVSRSIKTKSFFDQNSVSSRYKSCSENFFEQQIELDEVIQEENKNCNNILKNNNQDKIQQKTQRSFSPHAQEKIKNKSFNLDKTQLKASEDDSQQINLQLNISNESAIEQKDSHFISEMAYFPSPIPCNVEYSIRQNFNKAMLEKHKFKKQKEKPFGLLNPTKCKKNQKIKTSETFRLDLIKKSVKEKLTQRSLIGGDTPVLNLEKYFENFVKKIQSPTSSSKFGLPSHNNSTTELPSIYSLKNELKKFDEKESNNESSFKQFLNKSIMKNNENYFEDQSPVKIKHYSSMCQSEQRKSKSDIMSFLLPENTKSTISLKSSFMEKNNSQQIEQLNITND